jgi:hypothetical protein
MSKPARRGRGKRPRDEEPLPYVVGNQGFSPINQPATDISSSSTHGPGRGNTSVTTSDLKARAAPRPPPGKVAIPALKPTRSPDSSRYLKKGRTPHACDYCRKAKAGCSGGQPCVRCKAAQVACIYGDGKRDKERKSGYATLELCIS